MSGPETTETRAIIALVRPVASKMAHLSIDGRITLLCALLAQEICNLPPTERDDELRRVLRELPSILDATECGMRQAFVLNAKAEL
jgi:hypothetical protein